MEIDAFSNEYKFALTPTGLRGSPLQVEMSSLKIIRPIISAARNQYGFRSGFSSSHYNLVSTCSIEVIVLGDIEIV